MAVGFGDTPINSKKCLYKALSGYFTERLAMFEPAQKKRIILLLSVPLVLVIAIIGWTLFMNRVTVTFQSKAPYQIQIEGGQTINCPQDQCQTILAPGNYSLKITKNGYRDLSDLLFVSSGEQPLKKFDLPFIPSLQEISNDQLMAVIPKTMKFSEEQLKKLPTTQVFYDENAAVYLSLNPQSNLQTLYSRTLENGIMTEEKAITSFPRPLKQFLIFPNLKEQKIIVIDSANQNATLYFIDLKNKTRTNLLSFPSIKNIAWLPGSDNFLVEAHDNISVGENIFLYRFDSKNTTKLPLLTSLNNIVTIAGDRLIVATNQLQQNADDLKGLEGKLVDLENVNQLSLSTQNKSLSFVDFSLVSLQGRLIKTFPEMALPESVVLSSDKKNSAFKSTEKAYLLKISE